MDSLDILDDSFADPNTSAQSHLDDSKLGTILSTNSGGGGSSPCTRGKTMREFEAELSDLKQENFELKMKIYVLEEQKTVLEDERDYSELKQSNQHLQKELEKVKSELTEKEDLIFKAGEAMMLMSKKHEDDLSLLRTQAAEQADKFKETVNKLEQEITELKEKSILGPKPGLFEDSSAMYAVAFNLPDKKPKSATQTIPDKILELEQKLRTKSSEINDLTAKSSALKLEAEQLRAAEANLKTELEFRVQKLSDALTKLSSAEKQIQDLKSRVGDSDQSNQDIPNDHSLLKRQYVVSKTENLKLQDQVLKLHQRITELEKYNSVDIHKKIDTLLKENVALQDKIREMEERGQGNCSSMSCAVEEGCKSVDPDSRVSILEAELEKTKMELADAKVERLKTMKTIQAFVKQNRALTRDIERLQQQGGVNSSSPAEKGDHVPEPKKEWWNSLFSSVLSQHSEFITEKNWCSNSSGKQG